MPKNLNFTYACQFQASSFNNRKKYLGLADSLIDRQFNQQSIRQFNNNVYKWKCSGKVEVATTFNMRDVYRDFKGNCSKLMLILLLSLPSLFREVQSQLERDLY